MRSTPLRFQSGDTVGTMRCVTVHIINDTKVEHDEYFIFKLFSGYRSRVAEPTDTRITILEDDGKK